MIELKNPKFIPVLELSPFDFKKRRWKVPWENHGKKEWDDFVLKCLKDSGINNLLPVESTSDSFELKKISNENLEIIIKNHFKKFMKYSLRYWPDRLSSLQGGLLIKEKSKIFASLPGCCFDISDIKEWELIISEGNETWQYICLGHPEDYGRYKFEADKIIFEYGENFTIKKDKYKESMDKVKVELDIFQKRLIEVIKLIAERNDYEYISYRLVKGFSKW
jgi:hypothetical protein